MITNPVSEESRPQVITDLNELIANGKDGEKGYRSAADDTKDIELIALFVRLASQRGTFATELQGAVTSLGGEPCASSTVVGALHRGWLDLKAALTKNDAHAVLAECERAEDKAVALYRRVLDATPLNEPLREMIDRQCVSIKAAHDEVRAMRDHPAYKRGV